MSVTNRKGPIIEWGLCRCCGENKRCCILNVEYEWQGQKEVYADMFVDCFGLLLSQLDGDVSERVICATCVSRLREAVVFRRQVLSCEEQLLKTKIHVHSYDAVSNIVKVEVDELKIEVDNIPTVPEVKPLSLKVPLDYVNHDVNCGDNHIDDESTNFASLQLEQNQQIKLLNQKEKLSETKLSAKLTSKKVSINSESKMTKLLQNKLRKVKGQEQIKNEDSISQQEAVPKPRPKILEAEEKTYANTVTIVENSYVCPFTTSFSDYYCIYCRHTFTDPSKLREHTLDHDPTTFKDIFDNKKFAQIDIVRIDCRLCPAHIDDLHTLKEHLQKVHEKLIYPVTNEFLTFKLTITNLTCIECHATNFKFFHALKKHMAEHFGSYVCDICGAHYFEDKVLKAHQKTHQSSSEIFPCKHCGKNFKSRHNRYLHEAKVHKKEAACPCSKCDQVFFSYALRYRHMIEVHGEERMFPCDFCDRVYDSRKSLRDHNRRIHLKIMKHQCDLCDRRFYEPSRLKEHITTHTGEKNYRCETCGKSYSQLRSLKVHKQTHLAEKKYKCKVCGVSYKQNVSLKNHVKQHH